jgi:hypothetical protein
MTQAVATHELPPDLPTSPSPPPRTGWSLFRLGVVSVLLLLGLCGLGARAYVMQVQQRDIYRALAEEQYSRL